MAWTRRSALAALMALPVAGAFAGPAGAQSLRSRLSSAMLMDGCAGFWDPWGVEGNPQLSTQLIELLPASGMSSLTVTVGAVGNSDTAREETLQGIAVTNGMANANAAHIMIARSVADLRAAKAAGKLALVMNFQDTSMIGSELDRIAVYAGLGVRGMQLTYNKRNLSGDGCLERADAGLSDLGRATIAAIEAARVVVDFSHAGARTMAEGIAACTRAPVISHSGCRALHDNPRNSHDAAIRAVADKGGVFGIYFMPFLSPDSRPSGDMLIRHIEHAVNVAGEDNVSIGTDGGVPAQDTGAAALEQQRQFFERRQAAGIAAPGEGPDILNIVAEYNRPDRFLLLAETLNRRGWSWSRIEKLLGGNLLRVYGEAWGG